MHYAELQIRTARSRGTFSLCYRIVSAAAQEKSRCVGALRKHAGGMFLASDLGGYAAAASIWNHTAKLEPLRQLTQYSVGGFLNRRFKQRFWGAIRALPVADTARRASGSSQNFKRPPQGSAEILTAATGNCRCGQKYLVPEGTKPFYFNGAFFILAQVRGN